MTEDPHRPAVIRYKEITDIAVAAAQRLREHETAKAARLEEEIAEARARAEKAEEQYERVTTEADRLWNMAMSALWDERWMRVTPKPDPVASARPEPPKTSIARMEAAYNELSRALAKQRWTSR